MSARPSKTKSKARARRKSQPPSQASEASSASAGDPPDPDDIAQLEWRERREAVDRMVEELKGHPSSPRTRAIAAAFAEIAQDPKWEVRLSVARGLAYLDHPDYASIAASLDEDDTSYVAKAARASAAKRRDIDHAYRAKTDEIDEVAAELAKLRDAHGEKVAAAADRIAEHKFRLLTNETTHEMRTVVASMIDSLTKLDAKLEKSGTNKQVYERSLRIARERAKFLKLMLDDTKKLVDDPQLDLEQVEVLELLDKAAELVRGALEIPPEIHFDIETNIPKGTSVHVPRSRLLQAISSLAKNAIEACEESGRVTLGATTPKRGWVLITVSDTGYGMDEEDIRQALLPMVSSKKDDKHTGVGLPLAKKIIERECRGTFEITSKPDVGTTVSCLLAIEA